MAAKKKKTDAEAGEAVEQSAASLYNRSLKYGADGEDVQALQTTLLSAGLDVTVSGAYDLRTVRAVQQLQRQKRLPANGIIGKHDFAALLGHK